MMNYCDDCKVYVDGCLKYCPLCGKRLTDHPAENELYPYVTKKKFVDKRSLTMEYMAFATFCGDLPVHRGQPAHMGRAPVVSRGGGPRALRLGAGLYRDPV